MEKEVGFRGKKAEGIRDCMRESEERVNKGKIEGFLSFGFLSFALS